MIDLVAASIFLPLSHFLIASTRLRAVLTRHLGERGYSTGYSALAAAVFVWLAIAYRQSLDVRLWTSPAWLQIALAPVLLLSSVLVVAGLTTPNPVIVRSDHLFGRSDIVRGVLRVSRNPFLWGMSLLSLSLIVILGSSASVCAFGSIAFLGIVGGRVLDAKKATQQGDAWQRFAVKTSDLPFLAIIEKRQSLELAEIGWWRWLVSCALFVLVVAAALE